MILFRVLVLVGLVGCVYLSIAAAPALAKEETVTVTAPATAECTYPLAVDCPRDTDPPIPFATIPAEVSKVKVTYESTEYCAPMVLMIYDDGHKAGETTVVGGDTDVGSNYPDEGSVTISLDPKREHELACTFSPAPSRPPSNRPAATRKRTAPKQAPPAPHGWSSKRGAVGRRCGSRGQCGVAYVRRYYGGPVSGPQITSDTDTATVKGGHFTIYATRGSGTLEEHRLLAELGPGDVETVKVPTGADVNQAEVKFLPQIKYILGRSKRGHIDFEAWNLPVTMLGGGSSVEGSGAPVPYRFEVIGTDRTGPANLICSMNGGADVKTPGADAFPDGSTLFEDQRCRGQRPRRQAVSWERALQDPLAERIGAAW